MKTLKNSFRLGLIFLILAGLYSCEKKGVDTNGIGTAEFSVMLPDNGAKSLSGQSTDSSIISYQVLISVENMEGLPVLTDKLIPVYVFGGSFVSEKVEIINGEFRLTKFMVINPSGEVIFAAPLEASPLAYLIKNPLPLKFKIFPDQVTKVIPEVLAVGDQNPDKFGYATFGVQEIKPLGFWAMCIIDNPLSMAPTQITTAKLTVFAPDGWHYSFKLEATINHLIIRGGYDFYKFILEKEGYPPQEMEFRADRLLETTREKPLVLKIPWNSQLKVLKIQPGPERGKDAMISNLDPEKNFGAHKYFEATFLTEPVLTVMRTNNSLIFFNLDSLPQGAKIQKSVMRLSYEFPILYDSTILTNNYLVWFGGVLQQIVEPWDEFQVTWNKKPKTIEANQVFISPFIRNVNFIEVDVTRLFVKPATTDPAIYPNHGMFFRQWPSDQFPGFRFASSDFPEPSMRPMLTIYYTMN